MIEVITTCDNPPSARDGPEWNRWDRLDCLLKAAMRLQTVAIPSELLHHASIARTARLESNPAPPMAPVKREVVRFREELAWMLRQAGFAQARIARELGISQPAVCKVLRRVERRVLARLEAGVRAVKAKQAAQLEYIVDQAMGAWKASKDVITTTVVVDTDRQGNSSCSNRKSERSSRLTHQGPGDPRFLVIAMQALAAEREVWGLTGEQTRQPKVEPTIADSMYLPRRLNGTH
jgi:hypothetical protein